MPANPPKSIAAVVPINTIKTNNAINAIKPIITPIILPTSIIAAIAINNSIELDDILPD